MWGRGFWRKFGAGASLLSGSNRNQTNRVGEGKGRQRARRRHFAERIEMYGRRSLRQRFVPFASPASRRRTKAFGGQQAGSLLPVRLFEAGGDPRFRCHPPLPVVHLQIVHLQICHLQSSRFNRPTGRTECSGGCRACTCVRRSGRRRPRSPGRPPRTSPSGRRG